MSQIVVLKVRMSCEGCSGAVRRVLSNMEGVESFDIDMKEQKVTVKGNVQPEIVLQTVSTSGKSTAFWEVKAQAPLAEAGTKAKPAEVDTEAKATEAETKAKPAEAVATA